MPPNLTLEARGLGTLSMLHPMYISSAIRLFINLATHYYNSVGVTAIIGVLATILLQGFSIFCNIFVNDMDMDKYTAVSFAGFVTVGTSGCGNLFTGM